MKLFFKQHKIEIFLFSLAVLIRIAASIWMVWWENKVGWYTLSAIHFPIVEGDGRKFAGIAFNILDNGNYAQSLDFSGGAAFTSNGANLPSESYIPPGYPLIIAAMFLFFKSLLSVTALQIVLAGLSVVMLYKIAVFHLPQKAAIVPALLFAFDPTFIFQSVVIMSDGPFPFFILGSLFFLLKTLENRNLNLRKFLFFAVFAGFLLGYSALVRPISQYLLFLFIPFVFFKKGLSKTSAKTAAVFAVGFFIIVFPWMLRNKITFNTWQISSASSFGLYTNAALFLEGRNDLKNGEVLGPWWGELMDKSGNNKTSFELNSFTTEKSKTVIRENFPEFLKFYLFKTTTVFFLSDSLRYLIHWLRIPGVDSMPNFSNLLYNGRFSEILNELRSHKLSTALLASGSSFWLLIDVLMLIGIIGALINRKNRVLLTLYFSIVIYFALLTGILYQTRHRIPAMPFMFMLAVSGFIFMRSIFKNKSVELMP